VKRLETLFFREDMVSSIHQIDENSWLARDLVVWAAMGTIDLVKPA
jgi:hypothetical protein